MDTSSAGTARYLQRTGTDRSQALERATLRGRSVTWRNVADWDPAIYGAIARFDPEGREHLNVPQTYTLKRGVRMGTTPTMTLAVETLALNVLAPFLFEREPAASRRRLRTLARVFAADVLTHAAGADWRISCEAVRSWLASNADVR